MKELDDFLSFLDRSGVERYLDFHVRSNKGRPGYDRYALFATILFGFTFDRGSLRDIAKRCEYDMRYIYLMQGDVPSYRTIGYIGMERVDTDITLTLLGHNLRKLFKHFRGISESKYWVAPEGLESETFKKPRANILSRKVRRTK